MLNNQLAKILQVIIPFMIGQNSTNNKYGSNIIKNMKYLVTYNCNRQWMHCREQIDNGKKWYKWVHKKSMKVQYFYALRKIKILRLSKTKGCYQGLVCFWLNEFFQNSFNLSFISTETVHLVVQFSPLIVGFILLIANNFSFYVLPKVS